MRRLLCAVLPLLLLTTAVFAVSDEAQLLPPELRNYRGNLLAEGGRWLWSMLQTEGKACLLSGMSEISQILLVLILCGMGRCIDGGGRTESALTLCGLLGVMLLSFSNIRSLIGLGVETMDEIQTVGKLLVPTIAGAMASGGYVGSAGILHIGSLFASEVLLQIIHSFLLPMTKCCAALAFAGAFLPESRLDQLGQGLKKLIGWLLAAFLALFSFFLSLGTSVSGAADKATIKLAKAAVSGAVPVVGSLLSETASGVLASADALRAAVGTAGVIGILSACLLPLLQLGAQYVLFQLASVLAAFIAVKPIDRLMNQLADVFGLVFAMTASCAVLFLSSIISSVTMVVML